MRCCNCFHRNVCGSSSPYNDASMCKQFISSGGVLCGSALKVVEEELERLKTRNKRLETELTACEMENKDLINELKMLRIIKQTLEMQSGQKFDIQVI